MQLAHPQYLWLFLIFIPMIGWYVWRRHNAFPSLGISSLTPFARVGRSYKEYLLHLIFALKLTAIGALIIVLCRPQSSDSWHTSTTEGTDIIIALDISSSMLARDFQPDRLEAAKNMAAKFVAGRENDNIGLVIYAGESFTSLPMTTDRSMVINYIHDIKMGMINDGTAIGDGLATAINRIKDGKAKSKSVILITDGVNNTGVVAPQTAAEIAKKFDIKVYTIGVGKNGTAPTPQQNMFGGIDYVPMPVIIDEQLLRSISAMTGGKYFRATSNNVLRDVFAEIDQLEKTEMDVRNFTHTEDNYSLWAWLAIGCFSAAILLRRTLLRTLP